MGSCMSLCNVTAGSTETKLSLSATSLRPRPPPPPPPLRPPPPPLREPPPPLRDAPLLREPLLREPLDAELDRLVCPRWLAAFALAPPRSTPSNELGRAP